VGGGGVDEKMAAHGLQAGFRLVLQMFLKTPQVGGKTAHREAR